MLPWILLLALLPASAVADAGSEAPDCEEEEPLSKAAAELLLRGGGAPNFAELRVALRQAGSDLVGVRAFFVRDSAAQARRWLSEFKRSADAAVVCGVARSERGQLLLAGARAGALAPIASDHPLVKGSLAASFRDPQIVVEDGTGELMRLAIAREHLERGVSLSDQLQRPVKVQLLGRGPAGPRPLAERILAAGGEPAAVGSSGGVQRHALVAAGGMEQLAALRSEHGRRPLRQNRLLAGVAVAHARNVCAQGRVVHELASGSDPEQRLRRAGVEARRVGETIARAGSVAAAFAAFADSPSHRFTLLERDFTDVGIGEAQDQGGKRCVVVLLATWPRFVGR